MLFVMLILFSTEAKLSLLIVTWSFQDMRKVFNVYHPMHGISLFLSIKPLGMYI